MKNLKHLNILIPEGNASVWTRAPAWTGFSLEVAVEQMEVKKRSQTLLQSTVINPKRQALDTPLLIALISLGSDISEAGKEHKDFMSDCYSRYSGLWFSMSQQYSQSTLPLIFQLSGVAAIIGLAQLSVWVGPR